MVRANSTWDEDYKSGEESWAQAEIVKAHFRAPFETLLADEDDEAAGSDQEEEEHYEGERIIHRVQIRLKDTEKELCVNLWDIDLEQSRSYHRPEESRYDSGY